MASKSAFYDFILPFVNGADLPFVNFAIARIVRTIADQTGLMKQFFTFPVLPAVSVYDLALPTDTELSSIFLVRFFVDNTNVRLYPVNSNIAEYMSTMPPAAPTSWQQLKPDQIQLFPVPNEAGEVRLDVLLRPVFSIEGEVPDIFLDYREMVADGVLSMMLATPNKPWSDPKAADNLYKNFAKSVLALRVYLRSGGMPNNSTMKGVSTFGEQSARYVGVSQ